MSWSSRAAGLLAVAAIAVVAAACGGGTEPLSREGDVPPTPTGPPTPVDVCSLLPPADVATAVGRRLEVVGVEYGAARVPTFRCLLGDEFGVALVRSELAVGPIAENVFTEAYGESAGGDPELVERFGLADADVGPGPIFGFLRKERDLVTLHVYDAGSIVSLQLSIDPARPVRRAEVVGLAADMISGLPDNPEIAATEAGPSCSRVSADAVGAAIGTEPRLAAHRDGTGGELMCSWAASPGSVSVTVIRTPSSVAAYRRSLDDNLYGPVEGVPGSAGLEVLSRQDHAGDLTVFDGRRAMAVITVVPAAGFSDGSVATTPGERELAQSVIDGLLRV